MIQRTVAYLDTNTLQSIQLYLQIVAQNGLPPLADEHDLAACVKNLSDEEYRKACCRGFHTLKYFQKHQWLGRYSPFSEIELLCGRIKWKAFESIAKDASPDKMWPRILASETEIRRRVTRAQVIEIEERMDAFRSTLEDSDIEIEISKDYDTASRDLLDLAKKIVGLVYMSSTDSVIYAGALLAQADYFITGDGYLRDTVNQIRNNECRRYQTVRQDLQKVLDHENPYKLPHSFGITINGNTQPSIPALGGTRRK